MPIEKLPSGTRGSQNPPGLLTRIMTPVMIRVHRLLGNRMGPMDLLYLTTVGARSGQSRTTPVARFDDGENAWLVVASAAGAIHHPAWYHNVVAHPDQVSVEVSGERHAVEPRQLDGEARAEAWRRIIGVAPRFAGYEDKTDRPIPILRLRALVPAGDV